MGQFTPGSRAVWLTVQTTSLEPSWGSSMPLETSWVSWHPRSPVSSSTATTTSSIGGSSSSSRPEFGWPEISSLLFLEQQKNKSGTEFNEARFRLVIHHPYSHIH